MSVCQKIVLINYVEHRKTASFYSITHFLHLDSLEN